MRRLTAVLLTTLLVLGTTADAATARKKKSRRKKAHVSQAQPPAATDAAAIPLDKSVTGSPDIVTVAVLPPAPVEALAPAASPPDAPAAAVEKSPGSSREESGLELSYRAQAEAGVFSGAQVRRVSGGLIRVSGDAQLDWSSGALKLELPLSLAHKQTLGAWLPETRGKGGLDLSYRIADGARVGVDGGLLGVWRPNWDDLYQPLANGDFAPTSRYSYLEPWLGARGSLAVGEDHRVSLAYRFSRPDYLDDPNYDEAAEPMHITPSDHTRHDVELKWRWSPGRFHLEAAAETYARFDHFLLARDAQTGATHAGAGGAPPNPKQRLLGLEPSIEIGMDFGRLELEARYGHEVVADTFQGYYSFTGPHPRVQASYRFNRAVEAKVAGEAWLRTYGPNAYTAGPGHPALDDGGTRRWDRRVQISGGLDWKLSRTWIATLDVRWAQRETNFPDYVPLVYPASRSYDIQWDYVNTTVLAGVMARM